MINPLLSRKIRELELLRLEGISGHDSDTNTVGGAAVGYKQSLNELRLAL
jgi:hypothetical protein